MNVKFDIKHFILDESIKSIQTMPQDVYAIYFFINTNEGFNDTPTLALMYNTLSELEETRITPTENCWNIAYWNIDEIPIIGNNIKDTPLAQKSMNMLSKWFLINNYNSSHIETDPYDQHFEYTTGYRVLSDIIEQISPNIKTFFKNRFGHDVVLLLGEYSYMPCDIKRITSINGNEANIFIEYYESDKNSIEETENNIDAIEDEDYEKVFTEFIKKIEADFNSKNIKR